MIALRPAGSDDAAAIAAVFTASRALLQFLPRLHDAGEDRDFMAGHVLPNCRVTVAEDARGEILGFIAETDGWVEHLYLRPDARGQGIGHALLGEAKARQPVLELWCFVRNAAARGFYEREGFVVVEATDGSGNEEREPDLRLRWQRAAG